MADSTLSLDFPDLQLAVGEFLNYGPDVSRYTDAQKATVERHIKSGLRSFYFPAPLGKGAAHRWSFLRPTASLTTESGTWQYEMADEYRGLVGEITFVTTSTAYRPVRVTGAGVLRAKRAAEPGNSGVPRLAAVDPLPIDGQRGQRFQLLLFPCPDAAYALQYPYQVNPQALSKTRPHPYGGLAHAETIKEACLAAAERDELHLQGGPHQAEFLSRLAASIDQDADLNRPQVLGRNDNGPGAWGSGGGDGLPVRDVRVSYNGVFY